MTSKALTPFEKRIEDWEVAHPRQWIATTDRTIAAEFISSQAQKIVGAQLGAADRVIVSQERLASGIDKIAFGIDRVVEGLESLGFAFDWGFSEMVWQLEQQRAVLEEILRVLQAPLEIQAKELKKRAEDAYRNGWIDDALEDFLESEKKNRYDFTIHQSLGNIYLFHKKSPKEALEHYKKAARYAAPRSPYYASLALLHIGLIKYLQGDFSKAYEATLRAIELSPDLSEAHYQHAQYCAKLGKYDEAIEHLRKAIEGDKYYCLKADSERDFDVMRTQLLSFFEEIRNEARNLAKQEIKEAGKILSEADSYGASRAEEKGEPYIFPFTDDSRTDDYNIYREYRESYNKIETAKKELQEAKSLFEKDSFLDYADATRHALLAQKKAIVNLIDYLLYRIMKVKIAKKRVEHELYSTSLFTKLFRRRKIIEWERRLTKLKEDLPHLRKASLDYLTKLNQLPLEIKHEELYNKDTNLRRLSVRMFSYLLGGLAEYGSFAFMELQLCHFCGALPAPLNYPSMFFSCEKDFFKEMMKKAVQLIKSAAPRLVELTNDSDATTREGATTALKYLS